MFLQLKKTLQDFFPSNLVQPDLDPDPHSEKLLDPDSHKMNADPQPWFFQLIKLVLLSVAASHAVMRKLRSIPEAHCNLQVPPTCC